MARALRRQVIRDLLELVRGARVLRLRVVVEVEHAALVHDDVLEHGPERLRRAEDLRLRLRGQPDHLGVAAAFDVEDAVVRPAVLVVADQMALGIGGERRLAGPREPEEHRHAPVAAHVRGAVHRHHVAQRQPVVHDREDRLLDLARVVRPPDEHLRTGRVQDDERAGARAVHLGIGLDGGRVQHERFRLVPTELLLGRIDEERLREQRVPRAVGDDPERQAVRGIGAGERIDDIDVLLVEVGDDLRTQPLEAVFLDRLVDRSPPEPIFGAGLAHDELVERRAAGVLAGVDDERPALGKLRLAAQQRMAVQQRRGGVPVHAAGRRQAVRIEPDRAPHLDSRRRHHRENPTENLQRGQD